MSSEIRGMVFFECLLEDGEIEPDSGDKRLQEEDGELLDDTIHFITETIDDTEYHYIYKNIADRPSDEEPSEAIAEGGQDAVQLLFI